MVGIPPTCYLPTIRSWAKCGTAEDKFKVANVVSSADTTLFYGQSPTLTQYLLPFGGNHVNKVSTKWTRKIANQ